MRKTRRVDDSIEFFSVQRAEDSIARSDITVLVIDAEAGITEQDKKIADVIVENRKACIMVVNKWDLFEAEVRKAREEEIERRNRKERTEGQAKELTTLGEFGEWVQRKLFFLDYAPVIFTSAKSGFHLDRLLEAVRYVAAQLQQKIPTAILNRTIHDAVERRQPISAHGPPAEIFLRDASAAGAADVSAVREPRRIVFRPIQKTSGRPNCARRSATKAARLCWCRKRVPKPSSRCGNSSRRTINQREGLTPTGRRGTNDIPARAEKNRAELYSPRRISGHGVNASAEIPLILFGNNTFVTFLKIFLEFHNR